MIEINLLPPELRARTGTPRARFVAIVSGVVAVTLALGAFGWVHIELGRVRDLRTAREDEALAQEQRKKHSLDLQAEIEMYERRRTAIQTINRSRILWSQKLDQLFDIVTRQAGDTPYLAWLDAVEVPAQPIATKRAATPGRQAADGGQLKFRGLLAMEQESSALAHSSALYTALTGDPDATGQATEFFADFQRINNPSVLIVQDRAGMERPRSPAVVGEFRYELSLVPRTGPAKPGAKPAPGPGR